MNKHTMMADGIAAKDFVNEAAKGIAIVDPVNGIDTGIEGIAIKAVVGEVILLARWMRGKTLIVTMSFSISKSPTITSLSAVWPHKSLKPTSTAISSSAACRLCTFG